jgi:sarcosine oxidase
MRSAEGAVQIRTPTASSDVVVVGLGAMGSHALWRLARRGVRVTGVEQFVSGHDRGSSHGESRIIRTAYAEGAGYVPLVLHAWRLWDELEARSGQRLLERCGGLMLGDPESQWVRGAIESATEHGLRHELLSSGQLRERFPQHRVDDDTVGFFEAAAGVVRPERGVVEAVRAARAAGAEVLEGQAVLEIVPDEQRPAVRLADRTLVAGHVVVAAGAWVARLLPALDLRLRVVRRVQAWFRTPSLEAFSPRSFPIFVRHQRGGDGTWYGCPTLDGASVKVALHSWPGIDEPVDPAEGPRPPDAADAERISAIVEATLPDLRPRPVRMKSCMYTLTPDEHFAVGQRRDLPGLTLLAGFSGHGFKFAPVLGEAAAQLALDGTTDLPIAQFDPHRFDALPLSEAP